MNQSFKHFVKEDLDKGVVLFWGRCNPPTVGHELVFNTAAHIANEHGYSLKIYITHTKDNKKNPLSYQEKLKYLSAFFPRYKRYIVESDSRTVTTVLQSLQSTFSNVIMVTGEDRVDYFQTIFDKYNGKDYTFKTMKVISSGKRDPESESLSGISSSKMREYATAGDLESFRKGLPSNADHRMVAKMYQAVRKGLGVLKESHTVRTPRSKERELFYSGSLVKVGQVVSTTSLKEAKVIKLGSNYIVLEHNGETSKCWPKDIIAA